MTPTFAPPATAAVVEIDSDDARWDALVTRHPDAGVYHLSAWARILQRAYGYRPRYLALEDSSGELRGGLPLMETRGLLGGRRLRSLPVVPLAGVLAGSPADAARLLSRTCELARRERMGVWTLQSREAGLERLEPRLAGALRSCGWIVPLGSDPDELRAAASRNVRRGILRAERAGLTVRESRAGEDLRRFHRLYSQTMRRHHVLPRSLRQLVLTRDLLPEGVFRLFVVERDGEQLAGCVVHDWGGTVDALYNGSDRRRLDERPNHALYWHAIRWAVERGRSRFDFGRALPGTPLARFKAQFGAEPVGEYRYDFHPGRPSARAERRRRAVDGLALAHGRRPLVGRAWERTPLPLARAAGALAYRWL